MTSSAIAAAEISAGPAARIPAPPRSRSHRPRRKYAAVSDEASGAPRVDHQKPPRCRLRARSFAVDRRASTAMSPTTNTTSVSARRGSQVGSPSGLNKNATSST